MSIAFRVASNAVSTVGSGIDLYGPSSTGVVSGDLALVTWLTIRPMSSGPSGFTTEWGPTNYDGLNQALYRKIAGGSEPANYLCQNDPGFDGGENTLVAFSGVDTTTPIETGAGGARIQNTGGQTLTATSLTPLVDGCADVLICTDVEGSTTITTPPSAGAGWLQAQFLSVNGQSLVIYYRLLGASTAGVALGTVSLTWADTGAFGYWQRFLVRPAATGYNLTADQGNYTLTGQAVNFPVNRILSAAQGSYTLTGQTASLSYSTASVLNAGQGSYLLIGSDALVDTSFNADTGFYTLTGFAANLVYTPLNTYNLVAMQGSYTLTGFAVNLLESKMLIADKGQYNLTGQFNTMIWSGAPVVVGGQNRSINMSKLRIGL